MIRCIRSSFAKTWKVNRLHAVSFALSALICYSRSYEGNPVSAYTCHRCQSEKNLGHFFCLWAADLVICQLICSSYVASHSLDTSAGLYTFQRENLILFFKSLQITHFFLLLWGPSIPATWGSYHHDWVICKYISFIICFHTLTASLSRV